MLLGDLRFYSNHSFESAINDAEFITIDDENGKQKVSEHAIMDESIFCSATMDWYCIQLVLLNPITEIAFHKAKSSSGSKKFVVSKNKKAVYLRKVYLNVPSLKEEVYLATKNNVGTERKYKCPCWRVIGHWRHYKKSNKTIFINGYWKGSERLTKQEQEIKDRELAYENE
jgi:hypothetical protein